jgi:hypothetical protein
MSDDPSMLAECGESLFGKQWRVELAQALDVSERTVRRWAAGTSPVPGDVWLEINSLLSNRAKRLREMAALLKQGTKPAPSQSR